MQTEEKGILPLYENRKGVFTCQKKKDLTFPPHLHSDVEIVYVVRGETWMVDGGTRCLLRSGDCAVVFPGRIHSYETEGKSDILLALCPVEMAGEFRRVLIRSCPVYPVVRASKLHRDVPYCINGMMDVFFRDNNLQAARAYLQLLLAWVLPRMELHQVPDIPPADLTAQVIGWISEHYMEPVSLDILAEKLNVSKYRISRVFGDKLCTSISDYVNRLRVQQAQSLLLATEGDVREICTACGYENPRTFNREFKRICGCTPREFRQGRNEESR